MKFSTRMMLIGVMGLLCHPAVAWAGMPTIHLTDLARMRVQGISFFLAVFLLSAAFVRLLWNRLARDFTSLPRLTYGKAVGVVVLWGLLFVLVLTMVSGARELMTPGAWEKRGLTYRLVEDPPPPVEGQIAARVEALERLGRALGSYAGMHRGELPAPGATAEIPDDFWVVPHSGGRRYVYRGGRNREEGAARAPLAYEPEVFGPGRLVLNTHGEILWMPIAEIE